ncbi:MAG: hypothetical protein ACTSVY_12205 [Candidatus Helarchaeota archaeon]
MEKINELYEKEEYLLAARELGILAEEIEKKGNFKELFDISLKIIDCYVKHAENQLQNENFFDAAQKQIEAANIYNELEKRENAKELIETALENLDKAANIAIKNQNYQLAGDIFSQGAGYSEKYLDEKVVNEFYNKAIKSYEMAANEFRNTEYYKNYLRLLQFVAIFNEKLCNYAKAEKIHEEIIEIAKKRTLASIATESYLHLYECLQNQNKNDKAIKTIKEGFYFVTKEAELSLEIDDFLNAISAYENSLKFLNILKDEDRITEISENLANIFIKIANSYEDSNMAVAARYLRNAALIYKKLDNTKYQKHAARLLEKTGKILFELGEKKEAAENILEASIIFNEIGDLEKAVEVSMLSTKIAKVSDCQITTVETLRNAINISRNTNDKNRQKELVQEISQCLKGLSLEEENQKNFHVSASLLWELGTYLEEIEDENFDKTYQLSALKYIKATELAIEEGQEVIASYSFLCAILLNIINKKVNIAKDLIEKFKNLKNQKYFSLAENILQLILSKEERDFNKILKEYEPLIINSIEITEMINKIMDSYS